MKTVGYIYGKDNRNNKYGINCPDPIGKGRETLTALKRSRKPAGATVILAVVDMGIGYTTMLHETLKTK